jgi:hypothetical protein
MTPALTMDAAGGGIDPGGLRPGRLVASRAVTPDLRTVARRRRPGRA